MELARLPLAGHGGLFDALARVPDPRWRSGMRYPSKALLGAALCATLAGCRSFKSIWEWTDAQSRDVRLALGFRSEKAPSEKAMRVFLQRVDGEKLACQIGDWFKCQIASLSSLALDGKTLRGSRDDLSLVATQLVSAVTHDEGITLGQLSVKAGNEISAVQKLLSALEIHGVVITLDALHTQRDTATLIVRIKQADYVMCVKGNQPGLLKDLQNAPRAAFFPSL
jgi:hypothetical protein